MSNHLDAVKNLVAAIKSGNASIVGFDPSVITALEQVVAEASIPNRLEKRFDPEGWQWEENGKVVQIAEMSRDDLIQTTCQEMETLERMDAMVANMANLMTAWRKGEVTPDMPDFSEGERLLSM